VLGNPVANKTASEREQSSNWPMRPPVIFSLRRLTLKEMDCAAVVHLAAFDQLVGGLISSMSCRDISTRLPAVHCWKYQEAAIDLRVGELDR
jgi:hypothetical protein